MSNGDIKICDFREKSDFSSSASLSLSTSQHNPNVSQTYATWLNNVSSASFLPNEHHVISRDYLYTKLWDLRVGRPTYSAEVNDLMTRNVDALYSNDALDDEFFLATSTDGKHVATGAYNKSANVIDAQATSNCQITCKFNAKFGSNAGKLRVYNGHKQLISSSTDVAKANGEKINSQKQVTLGAWSSLDPAGNQSLALVHRNCIFLYDAQAS